MSLPLVVVVPSRLLVTVVAVVAAVDAVILVAAGWLGLGTVEIVVVLVWTEEVVVAGGGMVMVTTMVPLDPIFAFVAQLAIGLALALALALVSTDQDIAPGDMRTKPGTPPATFSLCWSMLDSCSLFLSLILSLLFISLVFSLLLPFFCSLCWSLTAPKCVTVDSEMITVVGGGVEWEPSLPLAASCLLPVVENVRMSCRVVE